MNKYIEQILKLDKKATSGPPNMASYGARFDTQIDYYLNLPPSERRTYEDAVLALCKFLDVEKANLGLYLCSELVFAASSDWKDRVTALVEDMTQQGLPLQYTNTISYAVIRLIRIFEIRNLLPFVKNYHVQIIDHFKRGKMPESEWETMIHETSTVLITLSPDDFWEEVRLFSQDLQLSDRIGRNAESIVAVWASRGAQLYGIDWLKRLVIELAKLASQEVKELALQAVHSTLGSLVSTSRIQKQESIDFYNWAKGELEKPGKNPRNENLL